jgi:acyl-CoA hydrolase
MEPEQDSTARATQVKTVESSRVIMSRVMQPTDANTAGNVHGGAIMRFVDDAGGVVAIRHTRQRCVTVSMDSMVFKAPVHIGDLVTIHAYLTYIGRTSMEIEARIQAEDMRSGVIRDVGSCHLTYVAIDAQGKPMPVPQLTLETDTERERWRAAESRRVARAQLRSQ